jgi:hypothetical protein
MPLGTRKQMMPCAPAPVNRRVKMFAIPPWVIHALEPSTRYPLNGRGLADQRGRIGASLWFGEAVGANGVAAQHLRKPHLLLRVAAEQHQRVAGQGVYAHRDRDRSPSRGDLLQYLKVNLEWLVPVSPLLGVDGGVTSRHA